MTNVLFLLALTSLASSGLFVKWAEAPLDFLGFWRLMTAGLLFLVFVIFHEGHRAFKRPLLDWAWPFISGLFFFLHLWTYMSAAQNTSIAHLMILFATNPLFTMAGAHFLFREKLPRQIFLAYPLALTGLLILVQQKIPPKFFKFKLFNSALLDGGPAFWRNKFS